jgi:hypothetical protein
MGCRAAVLPARASAARESFDKDIVKVLMSCQVVVFGSNFFFSSLGTVRKIRLMSVKVW